MKQSFVLILILLVACQNVSTDLPLATPAKPELQPTEQKDEGDKGFRWTANGCAKEGIFGLNPGFLGECGSLPDRHLTTEVHSGLSLKGANLLRSLFSKADLMEADLTHVTASQAVFNGANLTRANLSDSNFTEAKMFDVQLNFATFERTDLRGARLDRAQLQSAVFLGARLDKAILVDADLTGVDLRGASLEGAIFNGGTRMSLTADEARARGMVFWGR